MKNILVTSSIILMSFLNIFSQSEEIQNEKSKALLEKVSDSFQKNKTTKFTFELTISSEDINETQNGFAL